MVAAEQSEMNSHEVSPTGVIDTLANAASKQLPYSVVAE